MANNFYLDSDKWLSFLKISSKLGTIILFLIKKYLYGKLFLFGF